MATYLFDFDGTLVDSMPTYISAVLRIVDENNIDYGDDLIKTVTPLGLSGAADYLINTLGLNMTSGAVVDRMKEYMKDAYFNTIPAKKNVLPVLTELKSRGDSLNVLTASPHLTLDACLKRLGIYNMFDNVWSCDDFNTTKANPEIYIMAAERLKVKPQDILFLDDNFNADKTAKSAGLTVCGVYDDSSKDSVEEIKSICDYYIFDFSELPNL